MSQKPRLISTLAEHQTVSVQHLRSGECLPDHAHDTVVHPHSSIGLYTAGELRFWMGREYAIKAGDIVLVPEGMPHFSRNAVDAELIGIAVCTHCLKGGCAEPLRQLFGAVRDGGSAVRFLDGHDAVLQIFAKVADEMQERRHGFEVMVDSLLTQLAVEIQRASPVAAARQQDTNASPIVMRALAVIEQRVGESISLSDVARQVGRSPAHLAAVVKEETGQTVVEWITHARMAVARDLLSSTDETIAAIAETTGYASPSHFHRTFRREHQNSPGAWRRAHQK